MGARETNEMPVESLASDAAQDSPIGRLASVIVAALSGSVAGAILWAVLIYFRLGVRNTTPHHGRILTEMTVTLSFGINSIMFLGAANGLAQIAIMTGWRSTIPTRIFVVGAFLVDLLLLVLVPNQGIKFVGDLCSVAFHWAVIAMILRRRFSNIDVVYIVSGSIIQGVAAILLMNWILATP